MAVHPIKIHFENGAKDCRLKLLEGRGTWGTFGNNNFLTIEMDEPKVIVNVLESHFTVIPEKERGVTEVQIAVPGAEAMTVAVTRNDVSMNLTSFPGNRATFTLFIHSGDHIFFDAWLSRSSTEGIVSVNSPDGDETDYLLPTQNKRRVTLPLTPPPEPCE